MTHLDLLLDRHGSLLAVSRALLGDEWTRGRYQTLAAQVAAGELTGWVAACVAAHARIAELERELKEPETVTEHKEPATEEEPEGDSLIAQLARRLTSYRSE